METDNEVEVWHAMRATYRRELDAVHLLEKENLGCFVPMQYKVSIRKGKKVRTLVPVIRNLVLSMHVLPYVQRVKSQNYLFAIYNRYPQWSEDNYSRP